MAIDINDKVRMWGGFTPAEFGIGAAVLAALFGLCVIGISVVERHFKIGIAAFFGLGGPWVLFMLYQRNLPSGYLKHRWIQEGRFLFFHIKNRKAPDLYLPLSDKRGAFFECTWEENDA
jgi:hypothetical protein